MDFFNVESNIKEVEEVGRKMNANNLLLLKLNSGRIKYLGITVLFKHAI